MEGDLWVSKREWLCQNIYEGGHTELVAGWTYMLWENEPVKHDRHPEIPGFSWIDPLGSAPILNMNYVFFEQVFSEMTVADANTTFYVEPGGWTGTRPTITRWEIASTGGDGVGELWCPIDDGYVEPRTTGIAKLRVWFDQEMNTSDTDVRLVSIQSPHGHAAVHPCSLQWEGPDRLILKLCSALPDRQAYQVVIGTGFESTAGYALGGDRDVCITALEGDANMNGAVNAQDMLAIRTHIGEPLDSSNAVFDINRSGAINAQDMLAVRARAGNTAAKCVP